MGLPQDEYEDGLPQCSKVCSSDWQVLVIKTYYFVKFIASYPGMLLSSVSITYIDKILLYFDDGGRWRRQFPILETLTAPIDLSPIRFHDFEFAFAAGANTIIFQIICFHPMFWRLDLRQHHCYTNIGIPMMFVIGR